MTRQPVSKSKSAMFHQDLKTANDLLLMEMRSGEYGGVRLSQISASLSSRPEGMAQVL